MYIFKPTRFKNDVQLNQLSDAGVAHLEIEFSLSTDPERELIKFEEWVYNETGYYPSEIIRRKKGWIE